ncbi:bifunctional 3-(3-hydroxy-phenyl)propionate/3-hydroxycinnamic acid hydroxylase MhpA [Pseudomonas sp. N040]|uniref:bifunctional 3-(3-hydroxy-phenyl)propionate/3-hydroxycinnamic acid hydroxylase MhpA n=1 Tax=Pseudomonas sp. N040 TaxID=2785325 RepID=UPI0018A26E28|nr:bifunctional 3-(3-hydroxy-phenyl)propionate/3-hydroxycinnamic acid hydroxylase [Pseudomonas sp. N040]MBF7730393.1 bifunctional 3-(3-hydroxy-phenyl)propionate/3-hydroxycinnamic acid hydroxylase [Pseudomonas sp. N040]MBW7014035.1 bifunctional 3-(3-hydroxy-phenyl)propionate/3-hydroxycinnamic acid hydroxylase [Pseudomonas sp. N040]
MNTTHPDQTVDVVISGLGPTGLTLAHLLGKRGLSVVVLEREPQFYGNARAVYTDDECLRIFQAAGIAEELTKDMLLNATFQWVLPDGEVLHQLIQTARPYGWPANNLFYQPLLETSLADGLARYPQVSVRRGREFTRFTQDANGVNVMHIASRGAQYSKQAPVQGETPAAQEGEEVLRARYFVACDGGRSAVRAQLGINMTGKSFPNPWIVVDIKQKDGEDCLRHLPYFSFICDPECPTVSCRQPYGHHRFEFMLMPGQTREYMEQPETVRAYLSKYVDVSKVEILRSLVYTFNALVAEQWRDGRVFLAGDAAHMTPQFVGQGMNAGVRDAYNLAWKLDAVLRGQARDSLLDSYQSERRPHAKAMIDLSIHMKNFVSTANPLLGALRNVATRTARRTPGLREFLSEAKFKPRPRYEAGAYFGLPRQRRAGLEGEQLPQPTVVDRENRPLLLDEALGQGYALIGFAVDPRQSLSAADLQQLAQLDTRYLTLFPAGGRPQGKAAASTPAGLGEWEDMSGECIRRFREAGYAEGAVAIVRPDRFVFAMAKPGQTQSAVHSLLEQLGLQAASRQQEAS